LFRLERTYRTNFVTSIVASISYLKNLPEANTLAYFSTVSMNQKRVYFIGNFS
jgi:hypothetical protein